MTINVSVTAGQDTGARVVKSGPGYDPITTDIKASDSGAFTLTGECRLEVYPLEGAGEEAAGTNANPDVDAPAAEALQGEGVASE